MRVFLDACVDPWAAGLFAGHEVRTAFEMGWHQLKDHILLPLVQERFDVVVTIDQGMAHQHDLKKVRLGLVIVHVRKNKVEFYLPLTVELREAVEKVKSGEVVHIYGVGTREPDKA